MEIIAIIQARMGSTRLPNKVLKKVNGVPLLQILVERLKMVPNIDKIVVATSKAEQDKEIINFCVERSIYFYSGSEDDVLDRFYKAAITFKGDHIVRITADCPLLSPQLCQSLIQYYCDNDYDYVHSGPTVAEGLDCEIFSFKTLEKTWKEAKDSIDRLHLTMYIHKHPELFKKYTYNINDDEFKEDEFLTILKNYVEVEE